MSIEVVQYNFHNTPLGAMMLVGSKNILHSLILPTSNQEPHPDWQLSKKAFKEHRLQLDEYFSRKRQDFTCSYDLRVSLFQTKVLKAVSNVAYGTTKAYKEIAIAIKKPTASRAVGIANAKNPLPIFIPCHRIIGSNGSLVGYAGGLKTKEFLLNLEKDAI